MSAQFELAGDLLTNFQRTRKAINSHMRISKNRRGYVAYIHDFYAQVKSNVFLIVDYPKNIG